MNKTDLKKYREEYFRRSKRLKESSFKSLLEHKESPEEQENRIFKLLRPDNYNGMCRYYFEELCPSDCAPFSHQSLQGAIRS